VLTVAAYAVGRGLGDPSIPSGDVILIQDNPNGHVSEADYQAALKQTALSGGLKDVPPESSPQFAQVQAGALQQLIVSRWFEGEAVDRGITISDSQVTDALTQFRKQNGLKTEKQFQAALKQNGFTEDQAKQQIRLQLLSNDIQKAVLPATPPDVSSDEVQNYYNANIAQFQQPETRDFRVILNKDQTQVQAAADALAKDDSPSNWTKVAKQYSTDPTTKSTGGLRQGVSKGQSEPALEDQVFSSPTGQLVGPFKGENGYYLIEVEKITPASTTPLSGQLETQIKQQLQSLQQQEVAQHFQTELNSKWVPRTWCTSEAQNAMCANYVAPVTLTPGAAVIPSIKPVLPGHAVVFGPPAGLPQGPQYPLPAPTPTTLPGGVVPSGSIPPGATGSSAAPSGSTAAPAGSTAAPTGSGG
jgi:foldase protein PrsA